MARLVKTVKIQKISCDVITKFADGTSVTKHLNVDDMIEGLRYVEDEEVKVASGRISAIKPVCNKVTQVNTSAPVDYFTNDVLIDIVEVDNSEVNHSHLISVPGREIVEDEGVLNVVKVDTVSVPHLELEMTYTDGTVETHDIEVGDVMSDAVIMTTPGNPDLTGDFKIAAFRYTSTKDAVDIIGLYLIALSNGKGYAVSFDKIIRFTEKPSSHVTDNKSLSSIATALAEEDEVFAFLDTDVTIPKREDGKITTLMVNAGKTLSVDLNGHELNTEAYAFYVNGGKLIIRDTAGTGRITATRKNAAYPAVFVAADGECTMESGTIDTTHVEIEPGSGDYNWLYGVVCSGNGIFNMTGGQIITDDAAGISITNGTASGEGAIFNIGGNATITSNDCTAIYLADNKAINIFGKAKVNGGILMRMGDLTISDDAVVTGTAAGKEVYPLGKLVCESGCENHNAAILALTGCYGSDLGNDLNIVVKGNAKVTGHIDNAIDIATLNTRFDQVVNVKVADSKKVTAPKAVWNVYDHDQLAEMATEQGKTLAPETKTTELTIDVNGKQVYPV